jgi:hypothetical protein
VRHRVGVHVEDWTWHVISSNASAVRPARLIVIWADQGRDIDRIIELEDCGGAGLRLMRSEARFGFVPHFDVTTVDGQRVRYDEIWQRRNLVLFIASPEEREVAARYASQLQAHRDQLDEGEATVVVTTDAVPNLPVPSALVADRWGEILQLERASGGNAFQFPDVDELLEWVHFASIQCPECPP